MERRVLVGLVFFCVLIAVHSSLILSGCATQAKVQRLNQASAHQKMGISYLNERKNQEALVEFQKAVELNPDDRDSHYYLGHIYTQRGMYDEAIRELKAVLRISPGDPDGHNYLGSIYGLRGEWAKAVREYQKALKDPTYANPHYTHYNLGRAYEGMGRLTDAIGEHKMAITISPAYIPSYRELAKLYINQGEFLEAAAAYAEVLRRFPEDVETRYRLAWAYLKSQARERAVTEFEAVSKQFPESEWGRRSQKHLTFLNSLEGKLRPGMTTEQVNRLLGKDRPVVRRSGPVAGEEHWILNQYDLVLQFKDDRYTGYQESPR